jgi:uncharacterized protein (DUF362 family)
MGNLNDRVKGIYHFFADRTPNRTLIVGPKVRKGDDGDKEGKTKVARVQADANLKDDIQNVIAQLGPLSQTIRRGDRVLVKPNYNSPDPPPASTDLAFLKAVIEILREAGAVVTVGESSGAIWRPTNNVLRKTSVYELGKELNIPVIAFEDRDNEWVKVKIKGRYLKWVTVPRAAYEADKMIYLPCLKTHGLAGYSGALKLAFGLVHPGERLGFHRGQLQEKLADVNLWRQPDLIIMDGRKAFITGGPTKGHVVYPGLILASKDQIAIDVEAVKILVENGAKSLPADPWQVTQIKTAVEEGVGIRP